MIRSYDINKVLFKNVFKAKNPKYMYNQFYLIAVPPVCRIPRFRFYRIPEPGIIHLIQFLTHQNSISLYPLIILLTDFISVDTCIYESHSVPYEI